MQINRRGSQRSMACENARMPVDIDDPRVFTQQIDSAHAPLIALADATQTAQSIAGADEAHRALTRLVVEHLHSDRAHSLADAISSAPSPATARALWRALVAAWSPSWRERSGVAVTLFALPVVIVSGVEPGDPTRTPPRLPGVLPHAERLVAILREHRALMGNETIALASALVSSDAVDVSGHAALMAKQRGGLGAQMYDFSPAPIEVRHEHQDVHLRFLMGTAVSAPHVDLLATDDVARWGLALARELANQLSPSGVSVLALPRAPLSPPAALQAGRVMQRDVGAQLFASNAIRRLRASVGEPVAVISAHRCAGAPGGGELRLSLSSPLDPRQAEGFRCPLFSTDRAGDVATMLLDLLRDCRVADVRIFPGVHPDRDPKTGMILLYKPAGEGIEPTLH